MKRFKAFDPPEYLAWEPSPVLVARFASRLQRDPERADLVAEMGADTLLGLYRNLVTVRLHDINLKRWVMQGIISKAWLGTGEEAVTVGSVAALDTACDMLSPMIRNAGACFMMGMPIADLFRSYLATSDSPNGGRDLHAGDTDRGVVQPISHMGVNAPVMSGVALSFKLRGEPRVALTFIGDGATRTAACHEGVNFAAVQDLPVVFVLQNNQVALGTRLTQHTPGDIERWPEQYGLPYWTCDGNNVLDVFTATRLAVEMCRAGKGPAVIVADTFRMGGHATHDEREARDTFPPELFAEWGQRDPIGLFEEYLIGRGLPRETLEQIEAEATATVEDAATAALASRGLDPDGTNALYEGISEGGVLVGLESRPV